MGVDEDLGTFIELLSEVNFDNMSFEDQLIMAGAVGEFAQKTKPILAKYAAKDPQVTNFLMKL